MYLVGLRIYIYDKMIHGPYNVKLNELVFLDLNYRIHVALIIIIIIIIDLSQQNDESHNPDQTAVALVVNCQSFSGFRYDPIISWLHRKNLIF